MATLEISDELKATLERLATESNSDIDTWLKGKLPLIGALHEKPKLTLAESEAKFRLLAETTNTGIFIIQDERFTYANNRFAEIFGYTTEEMVHDIVMTDLLLPRDIEIARSRMAQRLAGHKLEPFIYNVVRKDGSMVSVEIWTTAIIFEDQPAFIGTVSDVTERMKYAREIQEKEQILSLSLQAAGAGVWVWDLQTNTVEWDETQKKIWQQDNPPEGEPFQNWLNLIHPDDRDKIEKQVTDALNGDGEYDTQFRIILPGGIIRHLTGQSIVERDEEGNPLRMIGVNIDVTDRVRTRELEIGRLSLMAELEKEHALADERLKMLSILSHELRTPLTIIGTSTAMLTRYNDRMSEENRREKLERIQKHVNALDKLITEVSQLVKASQDFLKLNPLEINIKHLSQNIVSKMEQMTTGEHHITLNISGEHNARVDERLLQHALENLLSNAIKYSPDGGTIRVDVSRETDHIVFTITDGGIGIPHKDIDRLFKPFQRASNTGEIRGTGLGLSLVKEIVEAHNGTITVSSTEGKGSQFTMRIPANPETGHPEN